VATTTNGSNVEALCRACWGKAAAEVFDVIAAGDEVAAKKPAPDVFLLALQRLGVAPAAALAFEDSRNGLRSALAAGLRVVVTPSLYTAGDDLTGAHWTVPSLQDRDMPPDLCALLG
jgi:beta-phosphoglucomutase-like phosphatase (HAD superfamily)